MTDRVTELERLLKEKERELEEFQNDSKEYEAELENELQRLEKEKQDWLVAKEHLDREIGDLRLKLTQTAQTSGSEVAQLQNTVASLQKTCSENKERIRELETQNDDLERSCR